MNDIAVERTIQTLPSKVTTKALLKQRLKWMLYTGLVGFLALGARYGHAVERRAAESTDDVYAGGNADRYRRMWLVLLRRSSLGTTNMCYGAADPSRSG